MKIVKEFSRFAEEYSQRNVIQMEVAEKLIGMLPKKRYKKVLDLGAGSGALYNFMLKEQVIFDKFTAFDFSKEMLSLHPKEKKVSLLCSDFNKSESFEKFSVNEFNLLLSASALQWSSELNSVLQNIAPLAPEHYYAFFTSNTFVTLHKTAGVSSPIYSEEYIKKILNSYFECEFELMEYRLAFNSVQEMLRYIKRSGVSGGSGKLGYRAMKNLMRTYPLDYLEFEVLFIKAKQK